MRIDYNGVVYKSNEIAGLSADLDNISASLKEVFIYSKATWRGSSNEAYSKVGHYFCEDIKDLSKQFTALSETINRAAEQIRKEDEAIPLA